MRDANKRAESQFELLLPTLIALFKDKDASDLAVVSLEYILPRVSQLKLVPSDVSVALKAAQQMYKWTCTVDKDTEFLKEMEKACAKRKKTSKIARQVCNGLFSHDRERSRQVPIGARIGHKD